MSQGGWDALVLVVAVLFVAGFFYLYVSGIHWACKGKNTKPFLRKVDRIFFGAVECCESAWRRSRAAIREFARVRRLRA